MCKYCFFTEIILKTIVNHCWTEPKERFGHRGAYVTVVASFLCILNQETERFQVTFLVSTLNNYITFANMIMEVTHKQKI